MIQFLCHAAEVGGHAVLFHHAVSLNDPLLWVGYLLLLIAAVGDWSKTPPGQLPE